MSAGNQKKPCDWMESRKWAYAEIGKFGALGDQKLTKIRTNILPKLTKWGRFKTFFCRTKNGKKRIATKSFLTKQNLFVKFLKK